MHLVPRDVRRGRDDQVVQRCGGVDLIPKNVRGWRHGRSLRHCRQGRAQAGSRRRPRNSFNRQQVCRKIRFGQVDLGYIDNSFRERIAACHANCLGAVITFMSTGAPRFPTFGSSVVCGLRQLFARKVNNVVLGLRQGSVGLETGQLAWQHNRRHQQYRLQDPRGRHARKREPTACLARQPFRRTVQGGANGADKFPPR